MTPQDIFIESFVKFLNYLAEQQRIGKIDKFRIFETYRRPFTQKELYKRGWTKTLHSLHTKFRAADVIVWIDGKPVTARPEKDENGRWKHLEKIQFIGEYWEKLHPNNRAGMFWKTICDPAHFQTENSVAQKGW